MTLAGKWIVVVGGTSGMGRATVRAAVDLGPDVIRPGYTDSEMWSGLSASEHDALRRRVAAALPTGRMGTPEDVAHAAIFLMTSHQTTGAVIEVSGGESLIDKVG